MEDATLTTSVRHCARCDNTHLDLKFYQFGEPFICDCGVVYSYWAHCPNTGEPILMIMLENERLRG